MTQLVTPYEYENAILRQHSENRLIENTLDHAIVSSRRQKSAFTPFQSSSKMIVSNNKGQYRYSPVGYERTSDNSQVLNLRKPRNNVYPMIRYVNGDNMNGNERYEMTRNVDRRSVQTNDVNGNGVYINHYNKQFDEGRNEYNDNYYIVSGNNNFNYEPNRQRVNNDVGYNNYNYNNNLNRSVRYSPNNVNVNDNNVNSNVNNNYYDNHSRSTNNIKEYNYNYNRNNYHVSQSQNIPEYRCRDNNSAHNNIMNLRKPPQYYKDSIIYHKYSSNRNDYGNSRFGDYTYNYYLNSPMKGDRSEDWRYPPQYYYMPKFNTKTYTYENY